MGNKFYTRGIFAWLVSKYRRIITFAGVGVLNTFVDFVFFTLAVNLLGTGAEISQAIGYIAGLINSFVFNRRFTFKKGATTGLSIQLIMFIVVNGVTCLLSILFIRLLNTGFSMNLYLSKILTTILVMAVNYFGYKLLVFGVKEEK